MPKRTIEVFICDICNKESKTKDDLEKWVHFSQQNPYVDRDFFERCVCPTCLTDIKRVLEKKGS